MKCNNYELVIGEKTGQMLRDHYNSTTPKIELQQLQKLQRLQDLEDVNFIGWDTDRIKKIYFKVQEDFNPATRELLTKALKSCLNELNKVIGKRVLFVKPDEEKLKRL